MKNILATLVLASASLVSFNVNAASFDCAKASTNSEKYICANPKVSALDSVLAETYKTALKVNPNLKKVQKDWNKEVRDHLIKEGDQEMVIEAYREQIDFLLNMTTAEDTPSTKVEEPKNEVVEETVKVQEPVDVVEVEKVEPQEHKKEPVKHNVYICPMVEKYNVYDNKHKTEPKPDYLQLDTNLIFTYTENGAILRIKNTINDAKRELVNHKNIEHMMYSEDRNLLKIGEHNIIKFNEDYETLTYTRIVESKNGDYTAWEHTCIAKD